MFRGHVGGAMSPPRRSPHVRLVPMTASQRDEALGKVVVDYADEKAVAGIWNREESLARAREEFERILGPHPESGGHEFFAALDDRGRRIGWLWIGPVPGPQPSPGTRWIYQIVVDGAFRGQGFGRGLLAAAEEHVRATGHAEVALNVFRQNAVAIALYASAGYAVAFEDPRGQERRKRLAPA